MSDIINKSEQITIEKGNPLILGVSKHGSAVNLAVVIKEAKNCVLNLYKRDAETPVYSFTLGEEYRTGHVFSVLLKGNNIVGLEYEYVVMNMRIVDPYVKQLANAPEWARPMNSKSSKMVRGVIKFDKYEWKNDVAPQHSFSDSIMYKLHVRGFTMHSSSKVSAKGTFRGVMQKADYLKKLGITAVILMPCYEFDEIIVDKYLVTTPNPEYVPYDEFMKQKEVEEKDPVIEHYKNRKAKHGIVPYKINYWGYSDKAYYMCPKSSYAFAPENPDREFKDMVKKLHSNGIEVIMEFSFGPGTDVSFMIDCLRFWCIEYHIDGFKLSRSNADVEMISMDPILAKTKIIAESFDEYRIYGNEYVPSNKNLAIMNIDYMNTVRRYLKSDEDQVGDFAYKFRRNPYKTGVINYITDTNGFTLNDLYSYDVKHNDDNGESNRDGNDYNYSWNCGVEGPTKKKKINQNRNRQINNAFITMLLSQGTPMILAGDEMGNSQMGNNNAYCQDNEISWLNWSMSKNNKVRLELVKQLIKFRKENAVFHLNKEPRMMDYISCGYPDMSCHGTRAWFPEYTNYSRTLGIMLCDTYCKVDSGSVYAFGSVAGNNNENDNKKLYYIAFNMHWEEHEFDLPKLPETHEWFEVINSEESTINIEEKKLENQKNAMVHDRGIVVFVAKKTKNIQKKVNKDDLHKDIKRKKDDGRFSDK